MTSLVYRLAMRYTLLFLLAFSNLQLALASLYPTHPTSDTNMSPGPAKVTWKDTHSRPLLREMGLLSIDLCTTDGVRSHYFPLKPF
jgi:hypothetical protein